MAGLMDVMDELCVFTAAPLKNVNLKETFSEDLAVLRLYSLFPFSVFYNVVGNNQKFTHVTNFIL